MQLSRREIKMTWIRAMLRESEVDEFKIYWRWNRQDLVIVWIWEVTEQMH